MRTSLKLKLNKDRIPLSGKYPIVFQIIHRRQRKLIYTGIKVFEESFNAEKEKVVFSHKERIKHSEIVRINEFLAQMRRNIQLAIDNMSYLNPTFTADDFLEKYKVSQNSRYVITYTEKLIQEKLDMGKFGTAKNYRYTLNSLKQFNNSDQLQFSDINYCFLKEYEISLHKRLLKANSIAFYIHNLRTIYNKAMDEDVFELPKGGSPFNKLTVRKTKTIKRALPNNVIRKVVQLDLSARSDLDLSRDLFMFSFYTRGMPFVDMVNLKKSDIENNIIRYYRLKTNSLIKVSITEPLQRLIDKYQTNSVYVLPCLDENLTQQENYKRYRKTLAWHNKLLKEIAELIGLKSPLTTYVARHTWATVAKEKGIPVAVISEGLGHSSEHITQVYLKDFEQDVLDNANLKVIIL